jgi:hypothetical protein
MRSGVFMQQNCGYNYSLYIQKALIRSVNPLGTKYEYYLTVFHRILDLKRDLISIWSLFLIRPNSMHMNYYIISFKAFIDCHPVTGQVGVISKTCDHYPNKHKKLLKLYYQAMNPGKDVVIHLFAKKVSQENYEAAKEGFLLLPQQPVQISGVNELLRLTPQ